MLDHRSTAGMTRRTLMALGMGTVAHTVLRAGTLPVTFAVRSSNVVATVIAGSTIDLQNGFTFSESAVSALDGAGGITLGRANPGVYAVQLSSGADSYAGIVAVAQDGSLTVINATGKTTSSLKQAPSALLDKFWRNCTLDRVTAVLPGAMEDWIRDNAAGSAVFIIVGILSGPFSLAFALPAIAKAADLAALVVTKVAESEKDAGILSADEAQTVAQATGVVDGLFQIPAIVTAETAVERVAGALGAGNNVIANFTAESDIAKLGFTITTDSAGKYAFALNALKKL